MATQMAMHIRGATEKNELLYGPQLWPEWLWYAWRSSIQGLEYHFERPTTTFTHTVLTSRSRFQIGVPPPTAKSRRLARHTAPHSGRGTAFSAQSRTAAAE